MAQLRRQGNALDALIATAEEMSTVIYRTSRSISVREGNDNSTAVFDAAGNNIVQAARVPIHLNTMGPCLEDLLQRFIPIHQWGDGDVLDISTTAEGVETEGQLDVLAANGCSEAQGYLFSQPCPSMEIPTVMGRLREAKLGQQRWLGQYPGADHRPERPVYPLAGRSSPL
jgi:hypothetical protein